MKFVIFALLFAGVSFAAPQRGLLGSTDGVLSGVKGIAGIIPALNDLARSLRNTSKQADILSVNFNTASDPNSIATGIQGAADTINDGVEAFKTAMETLTNAFTSNTKNGELNLLKLDDVNGGLKAVAESEDYLAASIDFIGQASGGSTADIAAIGSNLIDATESAEQYIESVKAIDGSVSGTVLGLATKATGVNSGLQDVDESLVALAKAVETSFPKLEQPFVESLEPVIKGLFAIAKVEGDTAAALGALVL